MKGIQSPVVPFISNSQKHKAEAAKGLGLLVKKALRNLDIPIPSWIKSEVLSKQEAAAKTWLVWNFKKTMPDKRLEHILWIQKSYIHSPGEIDLVSLRL